MFRWPKIQSEDGHDLNDDKQYCITSPTESQIMEGKQHSVNAL
jgi:hypothetical protein